MLTCCHGLRKTTAIQTAEHDRLFLRVTSVPSCILKKLDMNVEVVDHVLHGVGAGGGANVGEVVAAISKNEQRDECIRPPSPADSVDSREDLESLTDSLYLPDFNEFLGSLTEEISPQNPTDLAVGDCGDESIKMEDEQNYSTETNQNYSTETTQNCTADRRLFPCLFCDFSTGIEEFYHEHMASHIPVSKPHKERVYCNECNFSTGVITFLNLHMKKIHGIYKPQFYRTGIKRYRCRHCGWSTELRIDIEEHVQKHESHTITKLNPRNFHMKLKFICCDRKCVFSSNNIEDILPHIRKTHNIAYPTCYTKLDENRRLYHCFKCPFVSPSMKKVNEHALKYYSKRQMIQPYLYSCPADSCEFSTREEQKIARHLKLKHSSEQDFYRFNSRLFKCFSCGTPKRTADDIINHCQLRCKKMKV